MIGNILQSSRGLLWRLECNGSRDFAKADSLREVLQADCGVALDDDTREWWVGDRKDNRGAFRPERERERNVLSYIYIYIYIYIYCTIYVYIIYIHTYIHTCGETNRGPLPSRQ